MTTTQTQTRAYKTGFEHGLDEASYRKATAAMIETWGNKAEELEDNCEADDIAKVLGVDFVDVAANTSDFRSALAEYSRGHKDGAMFWAGSN